MTSFATRGRGQPPARTYYRGPVMVNPAAQVGRSGEAGETAFAGSTEGEHAVGNEDCRCAQPTPPQTPERSD
jgi:hypothetical protein